MTKDEAAEMIKDDMRLHHDYLSGRYRKALNVAIEVLKTEAIPISWLEDFRDGLDTLSESRLMLAIDLIIDAYRAERKREEDDGV